MKTPEELTALGEELEESEKKLTEEELAQVSGGKKGPWPVPQELVSNNALTITLDTDNHLLVHCKVHVSGYGIGGNGQGLFMSGTGEPGRDIRSLHPMTVAGTYGYDYSTYDGDKGNGNFTVTLFSVN